MHHFVSSVFHEFHQQMQNQHPQNHTQNTAYTGTHTTPNTHTDTKEHEENDTMQHFSHPHQLHVEVASKNNILGRNRNLACFGCKLPLSSGTCYACSSCSFYLHKFCFDLPQSAHFDSHPKHTLTLLYPPYCQGNCDACGESCNGFTYNCAPCNYSVHANCATLLQPDPRNDRDQYIATFLGHKVSEIKTLKSQLESTVEPQQTVEEEEANNILEMAMEEELRRRRHNLYTAEMMFSASSINAMGRIG